MLRRGRLLHTILRQVSRSMTACRDLLELQRGRLPMLSRG